jgi:hypothetical protein
LATEHGVSRKFVYEQTHRANVALDAAFPTAANDDEKALFEVKVTRRLLCQMILAFTLVPLSHSFHESLLTPGQAHHTGTR